MNTPGAAPHWRRLLKGTVVALVLTYASLFFTSQGVWTFDDIMGCESACIVKAAGWPVPYFYDYPGMSVGNRVEVDPISIFVGPDKFRLGGFVPTLLFWSLVVCCGSRIRRPGRGDLHTGTG